MSSRLLFVLVMAMMMVNTALSGKCLRGGKMPDLEAPEEETSCPHNTCMKIDVDANGKEMVYKDCGRTATCEQKEQSGSQYGVEAVHNCCEGELCNSSKSTSIVAVTLLSLLII